MSLPLETQKSEENFDLALIASLEIDVVPHLGDSRVPDYLVLQLGKMLQFGSQLQQPEDGHRPEAEVSDPGATKPKSDSGKKLSKKCNDAPKTEIGTTRPGKLVPRERFSYWCFDLLLLICSDVAKGVVTIGSVSRPLTFKQTRNPIGDGLLRYASPCFSVGVDPRW